MTLALVVEDEESFSDPLSYLLRKEGASRSQSARQPPMRWTPSTATGLTGSCPTSCSLGRLAPKCAGACANGRMCR